MIVKIYFHHSDYVIYIAAIIGSHKMYQYNPFTEVVFILFAITAAIQLFYYLYFYLRVHLFRPEETKSGKELVSVIICARNEAENLSKFLPSVLEQDYPSYEVIVVNDCSEDSSDDVLGQLLLKYPHLKISNVNKDPKFTHSKKFAQFIGIKAAKNDILLFTDADCRPDSDKWLEGMTSHFDDGISFVLGYGGYIREKGLLNKYIRYDSFTIAMQYLGMAISGIPYMGVGRNLAYRRSVFFDNRGYGVHNHIISGDDDLFVNSNAKRSNTATEFRHGTHTRSVPSTGLRNWFKQKKRHFTTAPYYKTRDKLLLITEPLTRTLFYISFVLLLSFSFPWPLVAAIFGIRLITQVVVFILVQKKLNESLPIPFSLFFDIFSPIINSIVYFSNIRSKTAKQRWN